MYSMSFSFTTSPVRNMSGIFANLSLQKRYNTLESPPRFFIWRNEQICEISFCFEKWVHNFIYDCQQSGGNGMLFDGVYVPDWVHSGFITNCINTLIILWSIIALWTRQTFQWRWSSLLRICSITWSLTLCFYQFSVSSLNQSAYASPSTGPLKFGLLHLPRCRRIWQGQCLYPSLSEPSTWKVCALRRPLCLYGFYPSLGHI